MDALSFVAVRRSGAGGWAAIDAWFEAGQRGR
jgi:hypothetical protein